MLKVGSEEIQVCLDEFADVGKFGLDFHTNFVTRSEFKVRL